MQPDPSIGDAAADREREFARSVQRAFQAALTLLHERGRIRAAGGRLTISHQNLRVIKLEAIDVLFNENQLRKDTDHE